MLNRGKRKIHLPEERFVSCKMGQRWRGESDMRSSSRKHKLERGHSGPSENQTGIVQHNLAQHIIVLPNFIIERFGSAVDNQKADRGKVSAGDHSL